MAIILVLVFAAILISGIWIWFEKKNKQIEKGVITIPTKTSGN